MSESRKPHPKLHLLAALAAAAGALVAAPAGAVRPEVAGSATQLINPVRMPLGVGNQLVTVVLQLAGDPVAVQQAAAADAGRTLAAADKAQIKAQLRAAQQALHGAIRAAGGEVQANYAAAYNGIKVRVPARQLQQLAALPGVVAVRTLQLARPSNVKGVPLIGAPQVWQQYGLRGEGVKIAIIDTGIDYTHANFGGPGTAAAYEAAHAAETAPADPRWFGPNAPRVKGGIDLAGDSYNADPGSPSYQPVPHADANPLDCQGHGTHVAGSAAGSGVTADGQGWRGSYEPSIYDDPARWRIGPGVAPKAELYAVRVFGCGGSTDLTVDAIEWAVDNGMHVINMSLGSPFGGADDPSAAAATNAAKAGVIVVASAGNEGPNAYMTGSPASADGAISVAAQDPTPSFAGAQMTLPSGAVIPVQNSNGASFANGTRYTVAVLRNGYPGGAVALGCSQAEYDAFPGGAAALAGKLVVTTRGTCSRVARAIFAQRNGAAASAMIDSSTGFPPFEGPITGSEETGPYTVTIPFFGVRGLPTGSSSDGARLRAADGGSVTVTNALLQNPNFLGIASFSSAGPRSGDSALKPEITAPGVSTVSAGVGTGNGPDTLSGTSMSAPHVAGVAALTRQAHPKWKAEQIKAAIVGTGDPAKVAGYRPSRAGSGMVQPLLSTASQVVARGEGRFAAALNFGIEELSSDLRSRRSATLENKGDRWATFRVVVTRSSGVPHSLQPVRASVAVPPGGSAEVGFLLSVPAASAGASNGAGLSYYEAAGVVEFVPQSSADNGGITLRLPYQLVPRPAADVRTAVPALRGSATSTATITNGGGVIAGDADFYAWGLEGRRTPGKLGNDIRAVGTQAFAWDATTQLLVFAVNNFDRWSNASVNEFDIGVDVDGDGVDDYFVVGADQGLVTTGTANGRLGSFVFSTRSPGASLMFLATAPTDSSTALLPVLSSQLCRRAEPCLSAENPRISYHAVGFDVAGGSAPDPVPGVAKFNVWASAISQGGFATVAPRGVDRSVAISADPVEWALTPPLGLMVVTLDNKSGPAEAQLIKLLKP